MEYFREIQAERIGASSYQVVLKSRLEDEVRGLQQKVADLESSGKPHKQLLRETYLRVLARKAEFLEQMSV
ncbi:MAG: hypothetical protein IPM37_06575 [Hahellaceae bacterium]|jgi:hypothetical protein|nr:hypothetical protein [Hahellaceae bacterium]